MSSIDEKATSFALTTAGYILGHLHRGRQFLSGAHGAFASFLIVPIAAQLSLGIYLKLHTNHRTLRPIAVRLHGLLGKVYPVFGWTQMLLGLITFKGYCRELLRQCVGHYVIVCL
jgi:hypothetical protein